MKVIINMNTFLRLEYIAIVALSAFLFSFLSYAWWWYAILFLVPDISMLGYMIDTRVGAWTYNLFHSLASGIIVYLVGAYLNVPFVELAGVVLIGHAGFDRLLGYGLKFQDSFKHTHLGNL